MIGCIVIGCIVIGGNCKRSYMVLVSHTTQCVWLVVSQPSYKKGLDTIQQACDQLNLIKRDSICSDGGSYTERPNSPRVRGTF